MIREYRCLYVENPEGLNWYGIRAMDLVDTVTGAPPVEGTQVRACWSKLGFHVRFECEDSEVISDYTKRDEPLYEQDVVELFLDEEGTGNQYLEIEVSPYNVVFDANIRNDLQGGIVIDSAWDCDGLVTTVSQPVNGTTVYDIQIPMHNFRMPIEQNTSWMANFYRIDGRLNGGREYQAWNSTGVVNYHVPGRFGKIIFEREACFHEKRD